MDQLKNVASVKTWDDARRHLVRIEVYPDNLRLRVTGIAHSALTRLDGSDGASLCDGGSEIRVAWMTREWRGQTQVILPAKNHRQAGARTDRALVRALIRAHSVLRRIKLDPQITIEGLAGEEGVTAAYLRRLVRLAFLAPDIQLAILEGRHPPRMSLEQLMRLRLPLSWHSQVHRLCPG
jgi:hypothetical protein